MAHDRKLLALAREELEKIRRDNEAETVRREQEIYSKIDGFELLDRKMRSQMTSLVSLTVKKPQNFEGQIDAIMTENLELQQQKIQLLTDAGYPEDYLEPVVSCKKCRDTGRVNGEMCDCLQRLYNRKVTENLSALMLSGNESFDNFDLSRYSSVYDVNFGNSPSQLMAYVFGRCREFSEVFPSEARNLLLYGGTGLGKTYLSACIAKDVSSRGYSVCYESASAALGAFERQQFSKDPDEASDAAAKVKRELDCDLMILDDLGTEVVSSVTLSALYTLINTRLMSKKSLIINTNLSPDELAGKYSEQICSRIDGCFEKLVFIGEDIRRNKKSL